MPADVLRLTSHSPIKTGGSAWAPQRTIQSSPGMASEAWGRATETELIREAQKGSRTAFEALVRQYDQPVLRLALRLTGSEQDAQDIHQEAFLKAYRYLANFRFECSFYTWIYRIVTNLCLDHLRRRKSRREDQSIVVDSSGGEMDLLGNISDDRSMANPERELERKLLGERIQEALHRPGELSSVEPVRSPFITSPHRIAARFALSFLVARKSVFLAVSSVVFNISPMVRNLRPW